VVQRRPDDSQTELFSAPVVVESLDPTAMLGAATRVRGLWRVRIGNEGGTHLVFDDRHGRYCDEHGRACRAIAHVPRQALHGRLPPAEGGR
jgi:hypothetical protein